MRPPVRAARKSENDLQSHPPRTNQTYRRPVRQVYINHFAILIDCPPEVMLFAVDLNGPAHRARGNGEDPVDV